MVVVPGDEVGCSDTFDEGQGCYKREDKIVSSICGVVNFKEVEGKKIVCVSSPRASFVMVKLFAYHSMLP